MIYSCFVSRSGTKRMPMRLRVEADDEACAAFAAWRDFIDHGVFTPSDLPPYVHPARDNCWNVSDGRTTVHVQILSTE
jgi:hypothetical protein